MTMLAPMSAPRGRSFGGFWRRTWAMLIKEFIQLKRDRVSFAMIIMIPLVQLLLFGYAINTNPRHLPTAVLLQEQSDLGRSILKAIQNTAYFDVTHIVQDKAEFDHLLASGAVLFAIEIPANFERAVRRGDDWVLTDREGRRAGLAASEESTWKLAAVSGGRPVHVLGEWTRGRVTPLGVWAEERMVVL